MSATVANVQRVSDAVRTTSSFIYGTSTLLGQEGSLDYLLAVREYVQERIRQEAESWRPEQSKDVDVPAAIDAYTDTVRRRTERILARVCRDSLAI